MRRRLRNNQQLFLSPCPAPASGCESLPSLWFCCRCGSLSGPAAGRDGVTLPGTDSWYKARNAAAQDSRVASGYAQQSPSWCCRAWSSWMPRGVSLMLLGLGPGKLLSSSPLQAVQAHACHCLRSCSPFQKKSSWLCFPASINHLFPTLVPAAISVWPSRLNLAWLQPSSLVPPLGTLVPLSTCHCVPVALTWAWRPGVMEKGLTLVVNS